MNLPEMCLKDISELLESGQITAMELLDAYLNVALKGCCITFCNDSALASVKKSDNSRGRRARRSPIEGIPFSMKDNIPAAGVPTTCNSKIFKGNISPVNAAVTERLLNSGAVLAAKNCMREFSVGKIEDSAYDLRSYLQWAGTNKNINIGAFSVGTDLGGCEYYFGLWTFKPAREKGVSSGIITGSPTLEGITYSARKAEDLKFLYPFVCGIDEDETGVAQHAFSPCGSKVLLVDEYGTAEHISSFLEEKGFSVRRAAYPFFEKIGTVYDCVLCTEFFEELGKNELFPPIEDGLFYKMELQRRRTDGLGFEVKKLIISGAHMLSPALAENTRKILDYARNGFVNEFLDCFNDYDFIASQHTYGGKLSKASAVAGLAELTVPFADALPFKVTAMPEREGALLDLAAFLAKTS